MDNRKPFDAAFSQIERSFGKGSIMRLGKNDKSRNIDGCLHRLARSRYRARHRRPVCAAASSKSMGPESSGKTTLALHCLAEAQKKGGICAFIDAPSMRSIRSMRENSASLSTIF